MCVRLLSGELRLEPHVHFNKPERVGACVNTRVNTHTGVCQRTRLEF